MALKKAIEDFDQTADRGRQSGPTDLHVGSHIRRTRLDAGLSQADLAASIGISYQQLQKYEIGANRISVGRLLQIADALKVDATALLRNDDSTMQLHRRGPHHSEITQLLKAFCGISSRTSRDRVAALAELLAGVDG